MANVYANTNINVTGLTWAAYDTLVINSGAVVTVNTDQTKAWKTITITDGTLYISNASTVSGIRFLMGRNTGATANNITPGSAKGQIVFSGDWIVIGSGNNSAGQTFTHWSTDWLPAMWVETASGSNSYDIWLNRTRFYRSYVSPDIDHFVGSGMLGRFFTQGYITPLPVTYSGLPFCSGYTNIITIGDGVKTGNTVPAGARVKVPNIIFTDTTPANFHTSAWNLDGYINLSNGGGLVAYNVIFDATCQYILNASKCTLVNCAYAVPPGFASTANAISEVYNVYISGLGISLMPQRLYWSPNTWLLRESVWGSYFQLSYISNAQIYNVAFATAGPTALTAAAPTITAPQAAIRLQYSSNMTLSGIVVYQMYRGKVFNHAFNLLTVKSSYFYDLYSFGAPLLNLQTASDSNYFKGLYFSEGLGHDCTTHATAYRPNTWFNGNNLTLNTPYYFKIRTYKTWLDTTSSFEYVDSRTRSVTPYSGGANHPDYFGIQPQVGVLWSGATVTWVRRDPTYATTAYEVYRDTTLPVTMDAGHRRFSTATAATVTFNDSVTSSGTYYYVLRKYDSAGVYTDSAPQEYTFRSPTSSYNHVLQSKVYGTTWVKTAGITITADNRSCPVDTCFGTAATTTGDKLVADATDNLIYQSGIFVTGGRPYCFSVYHQTDDKTTLGSGINFYIRDNQGVSVTGVLTPQLQWQRSYISMTTHASATQMGVHIGGASTFKNMTVYLGDSVVNSGTTPMAPITTTTATGLLISGGLEFTNLYAWGRKGGSGVELQYGTAPTSLYYEIFMGSGDNFVPSQENKIATSFASSNTTTHAAIILQTSNSNTFRTFRSIGDGGSTGSLIYLATSCANNNFIDFQYNWNGVGVCTFCYLDTTTIHGNNFFHNFYLRNNRNYVASQYGILGTAADYNVGRDFRFQNIIIDKADTPCDVEMLNTTFKGISCADAVPATNATTWTFGSTTDGFILPTVPLYDNIFYEFYQTVPNEGSLHLNFSESSKTSKPYTISGNAAFDSKGRLYFRTIGDSITYTWPNIIYGVSGFRAVAAKANSVNLGVDANYTSKTLLQEIRIDTGSGYGNWNIVGTGLQNVYGYINPVTGFRPQIRLTAYHTVKTATMPGVPTIGSGLVGQTSLASGTIVGWESGAGCVVLANTSGLFTTGENLRTNGNTIFTAAAAQPVNLPTLDTSYINGFQFYTYVDRSVQYPESTQTLSITGLKSGSEVRIYRASDNVELGGIESSDTSFSMSYDYYGTDVGITIVVHSLGYQYLRLENLTLGSTGLSVPVQQIVDRNYSNPA